LLVFAALATVLMVAYLVFGTARIEARAQRELRAGFASRVVAATSAPSIASPTTAASTTSTSSASEHAPGSGVSAQVATGAPVATGSPVARLRIPSLGLDRIVVEGVGTAELRRGPGHYPGTSRPGEAGNVAIAGHRTTYGAPFGDVHLLRASDRITLDTVDGRSIHYEVIGTEIVSPGEVSVLADKGDDRLTLTSCHPRRSARRRIVVSARRVAGDVAEPVAPAPADPASVIDTAELIAASATGPELAGVSTSATAGAAWLAVGAIANEARHRVRGRVSSRGKVWSVTATLVALLVTAGALWRGIVLAANVTQWNV
jgi:sortase A